MLFLRPTSRLRSVDARDKSEVRINGRRVLALNLRGVTFIMLLALKRRCR